MQISEQKDDEGSDQIGVRPIRVDFIVHNINTDVLAIRRVRKERRYIGFSRL